MTEERERILVDEIRELTLGQALLREAIAEAMGKIASEREVEALTVLRRALADSYDLTRLRQ